MMTGVDMVHVPYRGKALALTDLLGGQVQVMFGMTPDHRAHRTGKLRALAVTTATRSEALPDLPTVGEFVPGYEASQWYGIGAPKTTPQIVDKLNTEINAALADPRLKERLAAFGGTPLGGTPADFGKLIADETEKWNKVMRAANIKRRRPVLATAASLDDAPPASRLSARHVHLHTSPCTRPLAQCGAGDPRSEPRCDSYAL